MKITKIGKGRLAIQFPYSEHYVERIRNIKGRKWHQDEKYWSIPDIPEALDEVYRIFGNNESLENTDCSKDISRKDAIDKQETNSRELLEILKKVLNSMTLRGYGRKTKKAYIGHLKRFYENLDKSPESVTVGDIEAWILKMSVENECSSAYTNQAVSAFKYLLKEVFNRHNVALQLTRKKKEKKLPDVLDQKEIVRLLECISNKKHKLMIMLAYSAGLRVSEIVSLKIGDIYMERGMIHVRQAKGKKDRFTLLSQTAIISLKEYINYYKPDNWLFPGHDPDRYITVRSCQKVFEKAKEKAGIKKPVSIHTLRYHNLNKIQTF